MRVVTPADQSKIVTVWGHEAVNTPYFVVVPENDRDADALLQWARQQTAQRIAVTIEPIEPIEPLGAASQGDWVDE